MTGNDIIEVIAKNGLENTHIMGIRSRGASGLIIQIVGKVSNASSVVGSAITGKIIAEALEDCGIGYIKVLSDEELDVEVESYCDCDPDLLDESNMGYYSELTEYEPENDLTSGVFEAETENDSDDYNHIDTAMYDSVQEALDPNADFIG